jgi:ABC-type antimicrobial peptide transport system permease subunit
LYGLSSSAPLTILVALVGIAMVTLAAAFFPAHRAASIDPARLAHGVSPRSLAIWLFAY